eukprot:1111691-Amphidinium_carterae.1
MAGESAIIPSQRPPWARPPTFTRFVVLVAIGISARDASPPGMALPSAQKGQPFEMGIGLRTC